MAQQLGISRLPLREALRTLASQGLLTHTRNHGYFVTKHSGSDLVQILKLLEFLETELLQHLTWPDADQLARLRGINDAMGGAIEAHDIGAHTNLNREFHAEIYSLSTFQLFAAEVQRLSSLAEPYLRLRFSAADATRTIEEHRELIDALAAQDRARCVAVQNTHRAVFSDVLYSLMPSR